MKVLSVQVIKPFLCGLLVFSILLFQQCKSETGNDDGFIAKNTSAGFTKITGYIHNRDVYPSTKDITINISHISGRDRVTQIKSPINSDGTFNFNIDLACPQDATFEPYLDFLYLVPGDSLHIELDFSNLSNVKLSGGKSVEINNDFHKYFDATGYRTTHYSYQGVGTDCEKNCTWKEIMDKINEERNLYRERRQTFLQKTNVCDEVLFLTESMIELDYYKSLIGILFNRNSYGRETMDKEIIMNELNEVAAKYFNSGFYSNAHLRFIGSAYLPTAAYTTQPNAGVDFEDWVKEVTKSDTIKDFMFTVQAGGALLQKDLDNFEKYSSHINNEELLARLAQEYRATREKMLNPENISSYILGNPKDFTTNISFDNKNLLAKTISPKQGKVHIINISVAWCAPGKDVLRELAKLMKEYDSKDVCFSFICLSQDNEITRKLYRENGIDDATIHFTTNEEANFLSQTFAPLSFPYGILVNRKGVVVDNGLHVRPQMMLKEKIDLLLKQDKLIK